MFLKLAKLSAVAVAATTLAAHAAPIDLSSISGQFAPSLSVPEVTISTDDTDATILAGDFPLGGGTEVIFCGFDTVTNFCNNDLELDFSTPVTGLSFSVYDVDPPSGPANTDLITISLFDETDTFIDSIDVAQEEVQNGTDEGNGISSLLVDLSSFGIIGRVEIDDQSPDSTGGYFYAGIHATPIPLPAALPLMVLGLGALGVARSRKRKAA